MRERIILLLIIAIFVVHALSMNFTQDDAYISYRYVRNYLNGDGLVFNPGERVEGYTNFLWIILLSILVQFGLNIIPASKILGVASGCITLILLYNISALLLQNGRRSGSPPKTQLFALFPCLLLACNGAFAYWSISGLETAFFVMAVLLSVYLYFINERLMVISCALSSLIRPEGVLVFGILVLHKFFFKKDNPKNCLSYVLAFVALLLPFAVFKIFYYGDLLPNPFYAKSGVSLEYVESGLGYFGLFLKHYGLWGILYLLPILFHKSLDQKQKLLLSLIYIYTLYVIIIGGDVLMVHRFFLPVLPFLYLFYAFSIGRLFFMLRDRFFRVLTSISLISLLSILTLLLPQRWILAVRGMERSFVDKMKFYAESLNCFYGANFSIAASTIGALSYYLDARVIDMLGLTDKHISRHPEVIPGIVSSWKERRFNTQYLLSLDPDFILFSTGRKPSAPAEKALFLNSKFRDNYYLVFFPQERRQHGIFKKRGVYLKENQIFKDIEFVNLYSDAFNLQLAHNYRGAIEKLERVVKIGPSDFAWVYELMGEQYFFLNDYSQSEKYLKKAVQMDDHCVAARSYLLSIYQKKNMPLDAQREREKISGLSPGFFGFETR